MALSVTNTKAAVAADINVTPMIDVMLVLLIIFMIVTPAITAGFQAAVPRADNPKAAKASVFAGWKEMDAYMRENKIEGTPSVLTKAEKPEPRKGGSSSNTEIETETRDPAASRSRS